MGAPTRWRLRTPVQVVCQVPQHRESAQRDAEPHVAQLAGKLLLRALLQQIGSGPAEELGCAVCASAEAPNQEEGLWSEISHAGGEWVWSDAPVSVCAPVLVYSVSGSVKLKVEYLGCGLRFKDQARAPMASTPRPDAQCPKGPLPALSDRPRSGAPPPPPRLAAAVLHQL